MANKELKSSINELYNMLEETPDKPNFTYDFVTYLKSFLRISSEQPLPTIEIMTLIKYHKPAIFSKLRRLSSRNLMLEILTELSMDIQTAEENLKKIMNEESE